MAQLGQLLLDRDWITEEQLAAALKRQRELGGRLGTSLLEIGALSEELLIKILSEQLEVPVAGVEDLRKVPDEVHTLLPAKMALRHLAVPFRTGSSHVDIATLKVKDLEAIDELAFVLGKRMVVHIANEARIFEALDRYYGKECPVRMRALLDRLNRNRDRLKQARPPAARKPAAAAPRSATPSASRSAPRPAAPPSTSPATPPSASPPATRRPAPQSMPRPPAPPAAAARPAVARSAGPASRAASAAAAGAATARPAAAEPSPVPTASPPAPPAAKVSPPAKPAAPGPTAEPPAARPRAQRSVSLTTEERDALRGADQETRTGPRPLGESLSLEEMEQRLESVRSTEEVGTTILEFLSQEFLRTLLFRVQKDSAQGWLGRGPALDQAAFRAYVARFDEPSLFLNLHRGGDFFLGALPRMPAHQRLVSCWKGELGHSCGLFPIRLRDHLVSVVYGDRDALGLDGLDLRLLQRVTAKATIAFEMCIMRKKLRKA